MQFRTETDIKPAAFSISYGESILSMGSCFADNIGLRMARLKYPISVNPFGTVYNPISIRNSLALLLNDYEFTEKDVFYHNGLWHSFQHHGSFSHPDMNHMLDGVQAAMTNARRQLSDLNYILLTFGTAWVFELVENGKVVSNCHKLPSSYFHHRRLTVDEIVTAMSDALIYLKQSYPNLQVIISVSPIRHLADGAHQNQISKSILLLAVDELCRQYTWVDYFPAYEIMMDDLRDYRFYAEDMAHPSEMAVQYIWKKFESRYLPADEAILRQRIDKIQRSVAHRPLHPGTEAHQQHLSRLLTQMSELETEYEEINFDAERQILFNA